MEGCSLDLDLVDATRFVQLLQPRVRPLCRSPLPRAPSQDPFDRLLPFCASLSETPFKRMYSRISRLFDPFMLLGAAASNQDGPDSGEGRIEREQAQAFALIQSRQDARPKHPIDTA